jgi:hypothetical protein
MNLLLLIIALVPASVLRQMAVGGDRQFCLFINK